MKSSRVCPSISNPCRTVEPSADQYPEWTRYVSWNLLGYRIENNCNTVAIYLSLKIKFLNRTPNLPLQRFVYNRQQFRTILNRLGYFVAIVTKLGMCHLIRWKLWYIFELNSSYQKLTKNLTYAGYLVFFPTYSCDDFHTKQHVLEWKLCCRCRNSYNFQFHSNI